MIAVEDKHATEIIDRRNERAFEYSIKVAQILLKMMGAWPLPKSMSICKKLFNYLINIICYFLFAFILIPGLLRIFLIEHNVRIKIKIFGPLCACIVNASKYTILLLKSKKIDECIEHAKYDWSKICIDKDYDSMMSHSKIGRTMAIFSACFIYGGSMSYRTILPLSRGKMVINNVTVRALACPSYFYIFNEQKTPAYELVFIGQFIAGFAIYTVASGLCGLTTFFVMHACGQLEILMRMMRDVVEARYTDEMNPDKRIADIILHQIRARKFIKQTGDILQYMCLFEIVSCTGLVCLVLYYLVMEWEDSDATGLITYFVLFMSFTFNLFIFCYIGELLSEQGRKVSVTSCTLDWNCLPQKSARNLILIILMSNNPSKLVAGKMMDLSLSNFNNLIKTAVGYFNILRNTI